MLRGQNLPTRAVPPLPIPSPGPDESRAQTGKKKHRVAMLLPFIGPIFPSWFRTFAASLAARDDGSVPMDWFIFHEGARWVLEEEGGRGRNGGRSRWGGKQGNLSSLPNQKAIAL